jgi:hypothetical protein
MKLRPLFILFACTLLVLGAVAAGCKSSGGSTSTAGTPSGTASASLQEYFQKVQALDSRASERLAVLSATLNTPVPDEQKLSLVRNYITELTAIDTELRDGIQQLTPPPEAQAAHQGAIDALTKIIEVAQSAGNTAATAVNFTDAAGILSSPEARAANDALAQSCQALNKVASAHGIAITLDCGQ